MKTMGLRVQQMRKECKMTQAELGKELGVSRQTIGKLESGKIKYFERSHVAKLAHILGCQPDWLLGMEDSKATITYEAPGREHVKLAVDTKTPIIGESAKRAALFQAAVKVLPRNLDAAIEVLKSLSEE